MFARRSSLSCPRATTGGAHRRIMRHGAVSSRSRTTYNLAHRVWLLLLLSGILPTIARSDCTTLTPVTCL